MPHPTSLSAFHTGLIGKEIETYSIKDKKKKKNKKGGSQRFLNRKKNPSMPEIMKMRALFSSIQKERPEEYTGKREDNKHLRTLTQKYNAQSNVLCDS